MCMRTIEQTTQEILELATVQFKVPAGSLAADDDFYKKLGIDSLQALGKCSPASKIISALSSRTTKFRSQRDFKTPPSAPQARL